MNDLPLEIWDIIVKQNNETIFDKANELSLKECNQCDYIKNIMKRRNILYNEIILDNKTDRIKLYQKIDNEEDIFVKEKDLIIDKK